MKEEVEKFSANDNGSVSIVHSIISGFMMKIFTTSKTTFVDAAFQKHNNHYEEIMSFHVFSNHFVYSMPILCIIVCVLFLEYII